MLGSKPNPDAGMRLRQERLRVRLSTRDVERLSQQIAREKSNQEYSISHTWLAEIEKGEFTPSIYKLYSLSLIYHRRYDEILAFFGISVRDIGKMQSAILLPRTHLIEPPCDETGPAILAPLELRDKVQLDQTNLVARMFEGWGEIPVSLLRQLNPNNSLCGYVGLKDYTLYPLIRPGSFVHIDPRQRSIKHGNWQNEHERPVYFVELRESYACSWCQLDGGLLTLIPSPQSHQQVRQLRYPNDAEVVGRVTAVAMRIADSSQQPPSS